jgi:16S rRNA processing protein RimM
VKSAYLQCGYVARAHGLHGELGVKTFDVASEALLEVETVWLTPRGAGQPKAYEVEEVRTGKGAEFIIALTAVETRESAEALVGSTLAVPRSELTPPAPGEVFLGDLVGLMAVKEDGVEVGRVREVISAGPVATLAIGDEPTEVLLPFAEDFVLSFDVDAGHIVVRLPEYVE